MPFYLKLYFFETPYFYHIYFYINDYYNVVFNKLTESLSPLGNY
jgi:hypothetical protein